MKMNTMLEYLTALEQNNNQDWFHANKPLYQEATHAFEEFIQQLMLSIQEFDSTIPLFQPKELTFKLMRDTRFSHDKSPYNPCFRAHISSKGKLPIPVGYYIMLKPNNQSFLGGGLFADMFKDATTIIRDYIVDHSDEWTQVITDPTFTEHFTVGGTALKNVPRGYDAAHPHAEYLKNKSWYLEYPITDSQLLESNFVDFAADIFKKMMPFNHFLNQALVDFKMPSR